MSTKKNRLSHEERFEVLAALADTLNKVTDLDLLMGTILTEARHFAGAEAGSIYIREGERLRLAYSQNDYFAKRDPNMPLLFYKNVYVNIDERSLSGYVAHTGQLLNIEDVYDIPVGRPYSYNPEFDRQSGYTCRSILSLPLLDMKGLAIGVLQIINAQGEDGKVTLFDGQDEKMMLLFASTAALALERAQLVRQMILRTINLAEMRDPQETAPHAQRVAALAVELYEGWAVKRGLAREDINRNIDLLRMAAMLHDVGKVGISDAILNKPGRLDPEERRIMERHSLIGARLFSNPRSALDQMAREVSLEHHERFDGGGYPGWVDMDTGQPLPGREGEGSRARGKKGEEISIFGRVTALADVYDALISRRVYKEPFDHELVYQIISQESGKHFDPELVEVLFERKDRAEAIRERFPE